MSAEDPRTAALKWQRARRDKLDRMIRDGADSPHLGVRMASEDLKVERDHLVHLLGAIGEQDLRMYDHGIDEGHRRAAAAIRAADTSGWPGGRGSDVAGCQERAAQIAEQSGATK